MSVLPQCYHLLSEFIKNIYFLPRSDSNSCLIKPLDLRILWQVFYHCTSDTDPNLKFFTKVERQNVESLAADPANLEFQKTSFSHFVTFYILGPVTVVQLEPLTFGW